MIAQANPASRINQTGSAHAQTVRESRESKLENWARQEAKRVSMIPQADITDPDPDADSATAFAAKAKRRLVRRTTDKELQDGARKTGMTLSAFAGEVYKRLERNHSDLTVHLEWFRSTYKISD